jgi:hypothetical protein
MGLFTKKKSKSPADAPSSAQGTSAEGLGAVNGETDSELIAVISAAIAAYEAEQFVQTLYIRKLDRRAGARPVWGAIGTNEAIDMRRI